MRHLRDTTTLWLATANKPPFGTVNGMDIQSEGTVGNGVDVPIHDELPWLGWQWEHEANLENAVACLYSGLVFPRCNRISTSFISCSSSNPRLVWLIEPNRMLRCSTSKATPSCQPH